VLALPSTSLDPIRAVEWRNSPVGPLIAAATDDALCLLGFSDASTREQKLDELTRHCVASLRAGPSAILAGLWLQLEQYFSGVRREFELRLVYRGTAFQEQVWSALQEIRYGETWSYLDLARRVGDSGATRAVGGANGANPIAIVIPCHRVVNANGDLGGYGGGSWRKRILLDLELGQGRLLL
jgi:O-6-methylguanine DNA methyltransferase